MLRGLINTIIKDSRGLGEKQDTETVFRMFG